tara:strand:- start:1351 stop:2505 length:1155 start_codon:yes stop_codon:yes gene_type:complete
MTVVQPNSISGINSITVQSGESLSVHKADGSLIREIVAATGVGTFYAISVGTAGTISNTGNAALAGIVTANGGVKVGAAASIYSNGNATFSGIVTTAQLGGDVLIEDKIVHAGDTNTAIRFPSADTFSTETGGSEALRVDSSQRLLIGSTSSRIAGDVTAQLQVEGTSYHTSSLALISNAGASSGNNSHITLAKSRGSSDGSDTILVDGDSIGILQWAASDGTDLNCVAAEIRAKVNGTPGSNDMPGSLLFGTTADGAVAPTTRLTIAADGNATFTGSVTDSKGNLRSLPQNNTSGTYTLVAADAGKHVRATGAVTVDQNIFSTGDMITIYNNSGSAFNIVQGTGTTIYNGDDASTGNKSLKARGICTILCESNNGFVATGNFE